MRTASSFDYALVRVVPRAEREEFVNAGVIVFCLERKYLGARVLVDTPRLEALWPGLDVPVLRRHLESIPRVCDGAAGAGPIARLSARERFHWLVAPRSTVIQVSPVHAGICDDPECALEELFRRFVRMDRELG